MYADYLKQLFSGLKVEPNDILFLEAFQIGYLVDRVPKKEFAALLNKYPHIRNYIVHTYPPIISFIDGILGHYLKPVNDKTLEDYCQIALWSIAELIVYNKHPELYEERVPLEWELEEIVPKALLADKVVIDAGAGPGGISFMLAPFAKYVYAVEPVSSFRQFIRKKIEEEAVHNLFVVDGFLDSLPFPDNSADVIITSNAIGWAPKKELSEIERILKTNGMAIHLFRAFSTDTKILLHKKLISAPWKYTCTNVGNTKGLKLKYTKTKN